MPSKQWVPQSGMQIGRDTPSLTISDSHLLPVIGPGKIGDRFRQLPEVGRLQASPKQAALSEVLGWVGVWAGPDHSRLRRRVQQCGDTRTWICWSRGHRLGAVGNIVEVVLHGMPGEEECRES